MHVCMRWRWEVNKLEVDEHKQWSAKVRSHRFCPHMMDRNRNSLFHSIVYVHPPHTYSLRGSASFDPSTLKIAIDLPIFASYYALLCICYCFSHLIGLLSVTWLSLLHKFTHFLFIFCFSLTKGERSKC